LKFMLGEDNRRVTLDDKAKFAAVKEAAATTYGLNPSCGFALKFVDDDGDDCTLSNDEELNEARDSVGAQAALKIRVVLPEGAGAAVFAPKPDGKAVSVGPSASVLYELQKQKERDALERKAKEDAILSASVCDALALFKQMEDRERREKELAERERLDEERRAHELIEAQIADRRRREEGDRRTAMQQQMREAMDEAERLKAKAQRSRKQANNQSAAARQKQERLTKLEADIQGLCQMLDRISGDAKQAQTQAQLAEKDAATAELEADKARIFLESLQKS